MLTLSLAWRNLWRQPRRTLITAAAVGLGLAIFVVMMAYTNGFMAHMFKSILDMQLGHAQVHATDYRATKDAELTVPNLDALVAKARTLPHVTGVAPRQYAFGLAAIGDRSSGVELMGIDPQAEQSVTLIHQGLHEGQWLAEPRQALLGKKLADKLELGLGDKVVVTTTDAKTGDMAAQLFRVRGIMLTRNSALDEQSIVVSRADLGELTGLGQAAHEVALRLDIDPWERPQVEQAIAPLAEPGLAVEPWQVLNPALASFGDLFLVSIVVSIAIIFFIVGLGIVNTLTMSLLERMREFGVLLALGTTPGRVAGLILAETATLAAVGVAVGIVLGLGLSIPLVVYGFSIGETEMYGVSMNTTIHFDLRATDVVALSITFFVLTVLTGLITARRAAKLEPVRALRHT